MDQSGTIPLGGAVWRIIRKTGCDGDTAKRRVVDALRRGDVDGLGSRDGVGPYQDIPPDWWGEDGYSVGSPTIDWQVSEARWVTESIPPTTLCFRIGIPRDDVRTLYTPESGAKNKQGGRPPAPRWDAFWIEIIRTVIQSETRELPPRPELLRQMTVFMVSLDGGKSGDEREIQKRLVTLYDTPEIDPGPP
jgi:hypothetical protein